MIRYRSNGGAILRYEVRMDLVTVAGKLESASELISSGLLKWLHSKYVYIFIY